MIYHCSKTNEPYLLNLIDTPGHVDFSFEVERSLKACQGAIVLIDSTQGIQAQTFANFNLAAKQELKMLPVLTKIDLPNSDPSAVSPSIEAAFGFDQDDILLTSAKTGKGVENLLQKIISKLPAPLEPKEEVNSPEIRARVIDSWHTHHKGVICLVAVEKGVLKPKVKVKTQLTKKSYEVKDLSILTPTMKNIKQLKTGMVGVIVTGMSDLNEAPVGSYFMNSSYEQKNDVKFTLPKQMVYSSLYPSDSDKFEGLSRDIRKLALNDQSVSVQNESSAALGEGFRCGFVGRLHLEVFVQRLKDEFAHDVVSTIPSVSYTVVFENGHEEIVGRPSDLMMNADMTNKKTMHTQGFVSHYLEPFAKVVIVTPLSTLGNIIELMIKERRSIQNKVDYLPNNTVFVEFITPLEEVINDLVDHIKQMSSGYATLDYTLMESQRSDIVRVDILVAAEKVKALCFVTHRSRVDYLGRKMLLRLKDSVPREQFEVSLQVSVGGKIFARESLKAVRKDVLSKSGKSVGVGDKTRKMKLLEKQKKGKKNLKSSGRVQVSQKNILSALKKS